MQRLFYCSSEFLYLSANFFSMRLRQLARKLGVQPDKIVGLLAENGHDLENEANSKLTEEQESLAIAHFAPETEAQEAEQEAPLEESAPEPEAVVTPIEETETADAPAIVAEEIQASTEVAEVTEDTPEEPAKAAEEKEMTEFEVPFGPPSHTTSQVSNSDDATTPTFVELPKKVAIQQDVNSYPAYEADESYAEAELIKTEVPALEGLKVVGKIELPEPKKPEPKAEGEAEEAKKEETGADRRVRRNQRGRGRDRNGRNGKPKLNSVEYERQKAERIAKRKKAEAEKKLKEKKREHYLATVKAKAAAEKLNKKPKAAPVEEEMAPLPIMGQSRPKPQKKQPQGPKSKKGLKKFWAWLNGEYDKY